MPFHLDITIAGMCLLVRDSDAAGNPRMLHVLMPVTGSMHVHMARLVYLARYERSDAGLEEKEDIGLTGRQLDLSSLQSSTALNLALPDAVTDFEKHHEEFQTARSVPRRLLDGPSLPPELRFRLKVAKGDAVDHRPGGLWKLRTGGPPRRMATSIKWRVANVPQNTLELDVGECRPRILTPIDEGTGPTIRLFFLNVTPEEVPATVPPGHLKPHKPPPPAGHHAHHFLSYYPLVAPTDPMPVPTFENAGGEEQQPTISRAFLLGSEFTCMVAAAPAQPG